MYYRYLIRDYMQKGLKINSFRGLRRLNKTETKQERQLAQKWAISSKATSYEALKTIDRELGKLMLYILFQ